MSNNQNADGVTLDDYYNKALVDSFVAVLKTANLAPEVKAMLDTDAGINEALQTAIMVTQMEEKAAQELVASEDNPFVALRRRLEKVAGVSHSTNAPAVPSAEKIFQYCQKQAAADSTLLNLVKNYHVETARSIIQQAEGVTSNE